MELTFTINGRSYHLTSEQVLAKAATQDPEPVRSLAVRLHGRLYPVKQALAMTTGIDRADFQSITARSVLQRLGFEVVRLPG